MQGYDSTCRYNGWHDPAYVCCARGGAPTHGDRRLPYWDINLPWDCHRNAGRSCWSRLRCDQFRRRFCGVWSRAARCHAGIPVVGHLGLTPKVQCFRGFRCKADCEAAQRLWDAKALEQPGLNDIDRGGAGAVCRWITVRVRMLAHVARLGALATEAAIYTCYGFPQFKPQGYGFCWCRCRHSAGGKLVREAGEELPRPENWFPCRWGIWSVAAFSEGDQWAPTWASHHPISVRAR